MQDSDNTQPPPSASKASAPPSGSWEPVTDAQLEQEYLAQLAAAGNDPRPALWKLVAFYTRSRQPTQALLWLQKLLPSVGGAEGEAWCLLTMGCNHEQLGDFPAAIGFYRLGLGLEPADSLTWYFLHNNLGYCLNTVGRYAEGEEYCRRAIRINPGRGNAHKNLGLALKGQSRWREAARSFVTGTQADPADGRSSALLDNLLREHPELREEFEVESMKCRLVVQAMHERLAEAERNRQGPP